MIDEIRRLVRPVAPADKKKLPTISYSKLDNFKKCALSHRFKYVDKCYPKISSLAMDIGSIAHKGLELKGICKIADQPVDYEMIKQIVMNGYDEETEHIKGVDEIKKKYFEDFYASDNKSGMTYPEKLDIYFNDVLPNRMEDDWKVLSVEQSFEFVYDNRVIIHGFIDRTDIKEDEEGNKVLRIVDYKTSKAPFREQDVKTPLQHVTYDLACVYLYDILPSTHLYDFVFIDKIQEACSKGYLKRGLKKIDQLLDKMDEMTQTDEYPPSTSPLCYWCPYHSTSPNADPQFKGMCQYHSLWTPDNKVYKNLNDYVVGEKKPVARRKLMF